MPSEANSGIVRSPSGAWFRDEFERDLKFFQLFLLLVNRSCPIKRVDLVWTEDGPAGRVGLRQKSVCTEGALEGPCAHLLDRGDHFEPVFCNLVNDSGRHEAESCAVSDKAAELRVRRTGKAEVYRCHAGLVDIAVPVICDGQHIATLLTGQVLRELPSKRGFARVRKSLAALTYIDWDALENAYWRVPVVSDTDIQSTIHVLEVFAEYLANTWRRLSEIVQDEQRKHRERQLSRKEFAHMILEGSPADRVALRGLMQRIGFTRYPNRVVVIKLESDGQGSDLATARALQAVEELCDGMHNVCCTSVRNRGICLFFGDNRGSESVGARALANKALAAIAGRCDLRPRAGIGGAKSDWHSVVDSFHEACIALAESDAPVASYTGPSAPAEELPAAVGRLCHLLSEWRVDEARTVLVSLPLLVNRSLGDRPTNLSAQRHFFAYALDSLTYASQQLSANGTAGAQNRAAAEFGLERAATIFDLQEAFLHAAAPILDEVRSLYSGKREKLIERACGRIKRELENPFTSRTVSISRVASALGISAGHLSRIFKRSTGLTFERYLMVARVDLAKRMLLEPLGSVAEVADRCGFTDPTYFARVFRKVAGCSPRDYRNDPARCATSALPAENAAAV
jgi:AraC-like DNA-binding protein/ligand-binding sensor protein